MTMKATPFLGVVVFLVSVLPFATASVTARVWQPSKEGFIFPELDAELNKPLADSIASKEEFGIALAGGGLRGGYLSQGIVRSLRNAKILDKARYMSVTSGSVPFGVALQFQSQDPLDTFLGETIAPEQCTPEQLVSAKAGSYITRLRWPITRFPKNMTPPEGDLAASEQELLVKVNETMSALDEEHRREFEVMHGLERGIIGQILHCFHNLCECLVHHIIPNMHELWSLLSAFILMHPFGLARPNSRYCHGSDLETVQNQLGRFVHVYPSSDMENKLPYLLSQSAVLAMQTGSDQQTNPLLAFPLETTPMYTGVPTSYPAANASSRYNGIGGLYIDSFGFDSTALEPVPKSAKGEMKVRERWILVNNGAAADWTGVATSYIADWQVRPWATKLPRCELTAAEKLMPHAMMWSPLHVDDKDVPITQLMPVGDAGIYDDLGHIPLLRRGIKKMVMWDSSAIHDHEFGAEKPNLQEMAYTLAAFGQPGGLVPPNPAGSPSPFSPVNFTTVFAPSDFQKLWSKVLKLHAANKPIVVRDTFTVVDNPWFGIVGGWQVEIVWVLMLPVDEWRNALPAETRANLPSWLPNVLASEPHNQFELSALSQYGSWITEKAVIPEIQALLSGGKDDGRSNTDKEHVFV